MTEHSPQAIIGMYMPVEKRFVMVDDTRLEQFRPLWTDFLADYVLIEHECVSTVCNRDTQLPLMIEDEELRAIVTRKFIEAGIERIKSSDD